MEFILRPWHIVLVALSSWIQREQQKAIEYLQIENRILREKIGKKRILLNDDQRRQLAVKGKELGRKNLSELSIAFSPDTILRWHRELVARKWDYSDRQKRAGRPRLRQVIVDTIIRMAVDNKTWGYDRIQGALKNLGYHVSDRTVGNVLKGHGIEPAPARQRCKTWKQFLDAHWDVIGAVDFTTVEVWTRWGLRTYYVLIAMHLATRRITICGITPNPTAPWVQQQARNLIDYDRGFFRDTKYVLLDRDMKFCPFRGVLEGGEQEIVLLPPRSPNLNTYIERFMRTLKHECLNNLIFFGENSLRYTLAEFKKHYHKERNHQGLDNKLIESVRELGNTGSIRCRKRLGGMLSYYYREAA